MKNHFHMFILSILLFSVLPVFSQLALLSSQNQRSLVRLSAYQLDMSGITNNTYVIIGTLPRIEDENISIQELDDSFDDTYSYHVLYPLQNYDLNEIEKYGNVLFKDPNFIVFKSLESNLNQYAVFHPFQCTPILRGNVMPQFRDFQEEKTKSSTKHSPTHRQDIQTLVDAVSMDSLWAQMTKIVTLERHSTSSQAKQSAETLQNILKQYKFDEVTLQDIGSNYSPNIVAIKYGIEQKDSLYLMGGHYDTYAANVEGADDNTSGTVAVIEAARVLSKASFKKTLVFLLFSAEEIGLIGSGKYASKAKQEGKKIGGLINIDVTLFRANNKPEVQITYDDRSKELYQSYEGASKKYQPSIPTLDAYKSQYKNASDNKSFWNNGFKALMVNGQLIGSINPNMHKSSDKMSASNVCKEQLLAVTKASVATLATLAEIKEMTAIQPQNTAKKLLPIQLLNINHHAKTMVLSLHSPIKIGGIINILTVHGKRVHSQKAEVASPVISIDYGSTIRASGMYYLQLNNIIIPIGVLN